MRSIAVLALVVAAAILGPARAQQPQPATAQELIATFDGRMAQGERIVAAIGEMYARDQFARQLIIEGFHRNMTAETRQAYIDGTRRHFDRIDQANTRALKRILDRISYEELMALSPSAADQAFSIISHSPDDAFKRRMVAVFEPLARAGRLPGERIALLVDDLAIAEGRPQVYGTNFECVGGVHQPRLTEDMERLNERRAALGMSTIEQYTALMNEMYGACPTD
jgi:hypothetical protein